MIQTGLRRTLAMAMLFVFLFVVWPVLSIYFYGAMFHSNQSKADAAVVLGAAVWGRRASPVFRERINHAIALYHENRVRFLLFTGGKGERHEVEESVLAQQLALEADIPARHILLETRSYNTYTNLLYAGEVAREHDLQSFFIVTDPPHMKRAMAMAQDLKLRATPSPAAKTRIQTFRAKLRFVLRESITYLSFIYLRHFVSFKLLSWEFKGK